jgi:ABC-type transporter Mla subunit MlaD
LPDRITNLGTIMDTHLKASLQNLNEHLAQGEPVNEELRTSLTRLDGDIQQLLEQRAAARAAQGDTLDEVPATAPATTGEEIPLSPEGLPEKPLDSHTYGLAERTQELSAKFAAEHPKLEPALRELGNILSSMGI